MIASQDFEKIVQSFGIKASCVDCSETGNYFNYDLKLYPNAKVNHIRRCCDEISLALKTPCKPSIKVLHKEGIVRLEFATAGASGLNLFDYFENNDIPNGEVNILLGQDVSGKRVWMDLSKNPNLLVAGTTGSGKSTLLNNIIANCFNYNDVCIKLIDPKKIEFVDYEEKLGMQVAYNYLDAYDMLDDLVGIMETRYDILRFDNRSNIRPIVVIIDEFADLIIQDKDNLFKDIICRLAQKCRAAHIYIILATQRPSVNVVSGAIKANFPARIACRLPSHVDSKVVLDAVGAENLLGGGDALIRDSFRNMERFQIAYTNAKEVTNYFGER